MAAFSRPLIALSLTDPDDGLLHYSALVARLFQWSDVHFAHVASEDHSTTPWDPQPWQDQLQERFGRLFGQQAAQFRPAFHAVQGPRLDRLLQLAVQHDRDLIVLGHRRMRSGRRSLARRLAMIAPCSVWLVPEGAPPQISGILAPTDFSGPSAESLSIAAEIARAAVLDRCLAVHVYFDPSTVRYDEHVAEVQGQEAAALECFIAGVDTGGIQVEGILEESTHPAEAIVRVAKRFAADLIVMSTRGRSRAASVLLGSTTSETMAATTVPLLAVKHHGSRMSLLQALLNHRFWEEKTPKTN